MASNQSFGTSLAATGKLPAGFTTTPNTSIAPASSAGFGFAAKPTASATSNGFTFGGGASLAPGNPTTVPPTTATSTGPTNFTFGAAPVNPTTATATATTTPATSFNLTGVTAPVNPTIVAPATSSAPGPTSAGFTFGGGAGIATPDPATTPPPVTASAGPTSFTFGGGAAAPTNPAAATTAPVTSFNITGTATPAPVSAVPATASSAPTLAGFGTLPAATATTAPLATNPAAAVSSFGSAPPVAASAVAPIQSLPAEYRNESVQEIIASWHRELGDDLQRFQEQAKRVSSWDTQLRENMRLAEQLSDEVVKLYAYHDEIRRDCTLIEQYQKDLDEDLNVIAAKLEEEERALVGQTPSEDDREREQTFHLAEQLDQQLTQMEGSLQKLVKDFNLSRGEGFGTGNIGKVSI